MKLAMDLGRSGLRVKDREVLETTDSAYKEVQDSAAVREECKGHYDDFKIIACPWGNVTGKRYVKNDAINFYEGTVIYPDNQDHKITQDATYINLCYIVGKKLIEERMRNEDVESEPIKLGICIPAIEFFGNDADALKENLKGDYNVYFNLLGEEVKFTLKSENITVAAEGVCAIIPLITNAETVGKVKNSILAVIDAGHGSTDITIFSNGRPKGISARSFPIGGITLETRVSSSLERNGYIASQTNVKEAIRTGMVSVGNHQESVGTLVAECKKILAKAIVERLKEVVNYEMLGASEITGIVPIGRCFLTAKDGGVDTGDLMQYIKEEWNFEVDIYDTLNGGDDQGVANVLGLWKLLENRV